ncbi:MAG: 1-deoxy-D-xylulose-5-phosphate reductoisomerase [Balneolaceae bacterium]
MKQKRVAILGSTGSIGTQALEIAARHPESFAVAGLSANGNWSLLASQVNQFKPDMAVLCDESARKAFEEKLTWRPKQILYGSEHLHELAVMESAEIILNSLVGFAGFVPTCEALKAGKRVALANKESLVAGGELITELIRETPGQLIPVDSEHSAMLQCLVGEPREGIEKIIITASGGPFRTWSRKQMESVRVEDALSHPNWNMGSKITVDSATLMNKGLEIIEAHWLFGLPVEKIEPVIHPQSIIHSMIEFSDGSTKAQLGPPDMRVPIIYALSYPDRLPLDVPRIDWNRHQEMTFEPVDFERFPCLGLAMEAARQGGHAPAILNAANEVAVERFLKKEIGYIDIARVVEESLAQVQMHTDVSSESLQEADRETRRWARTYTS